MHKANKFRKNFFALMRVVLFAGVLFLLYYQINTFSSDDWNQFSVTNPIALIVGILLVVPNIWCVFRMWSLTLNLLKLNDDRSRRIQSFFAGLITGMLTPNMLGNFIGRLYYYDKKYRLPITGLTMLSNFAQYFTSLIFGALAFLLFDTSFLVFDENVVYLVIVLVFVVSFYLYFFGENLIPERHDRWGLIELKELLRLDRSFRWRLLALSSLRFLIFSSQFYLVLMAFDPSVSLRLIPTIWIVYLLTLLAPSLFLGKLGVKETIALFVLTSAGVNDYAVLFTSLIVWFVNSLSPALLGLFICKKKAST